MTDRCKLIHGGDEALGKTGVHYKAGVSAITAGAHALCMEVATLPPGGRARAHLHADHESAAYIISGEFVFWCGEQLEERLVARPGDFLYIPSGVPHLPENGSKTEAAIAVLARTDPHENESAVPMPELDSLPHLHVEQRR
jgi:uncharacterized RmlC-like cupin family protein